jgi:hypothetical protein
MTESTREAPEVREPGAAVHRIAVPPVARALCTLSDIAYADAFLLETGLAVQCSAEQCGRVVLAGAPLATRVRLQLGWSAIGLKPAISGSSRSILGWEIRSSTNEFVLLGRDSLIGMPGELLFKHDKDSVLFCTFLQHNNVVARGIWASIETTHVRIVRDLLEQSRHRLLSDS